MNIAQQYIVQQLRKELGETEETEHLVDWLLDAWETLEILSDRFGEARALQLLTGMLHCSAQIHRRPLRFEYI